MDEAERKDVLIVREDAIRRTRMEKGMSLRELNRGLPSMTYATLWHAERGYPVRPGTARRIAQALGVQIMDLFEIVSKQDAVARADAIDGVREANR